MKRVYEVVFDVKIKERGEPLVRSCNVIAFDAPRAIAKASRIMKRSTFTGEELRPQWLEVREAKILAEAEA